MDGNPRERLLRGEGVGDGGKQADEPTATRGVYMISVAAELAGMHPQTLRIYEARGLITPKRSPKNTRLYSQEDVERLRRIQELTSELGMNLAGRREGVRARAGDASGCSARMRALERAGRAVRARDARRRSSACGGRSGASWCRTSRRDGARAAGRRRAVQIPIQRVGKRLDLLH